ncbi:amidohydrolase [Caldalkalibacillus salinus]|uniref:amidohydrolase n=1 Tax=Caldalkalibacillus salinus TaxID=2803787 RepID=UPI001924E459|nr:amidohydrolase [Caldalkalibacillus salinus]
MSLKLFVNGYIHTFDEDVPYATAVAVQHGRIVEVGESDRILYKYKHDAADIIDLRQGTVLPGLTDSHMHLIAHGQKLKALDFSACQSAQEMRALLEEKVRQTPQGEWILGLGWNENNFPDKKIFTKEELDDISSTHPIFLTRICGHAYLANSKAMKISDISDRTPDPSGGKIMRDQQGQPTGLFLEQAGLLIYQHVPDESYDDLKEALQLAIKDCWRLGITGCHTEDVRYTGSYLRTMQLFQEVIREERHPFRVHELVYHDYLEEYVASGDTYGSGDLYIEAGAVKIFADGAMGGRSALLKQPYSDDPSTNGVAIHSPERLKDIVAKARLYHLPVAVHTIGDLALDMTLDALEDHPVSAGQIDRIIHAQVLDQTLLERLQKLPVVVDIQPRFVASDFPWIAERLGPDRLPWSYAWKTLLEGQVACAGGSDAPIEPVNPLLGMHAAVARTVPGEAPHEGYGPEQKLTMNEAVKLFTVGSAYAERKTELKGSIKKGKLADFTVINKNIFHTHNVDDLLTTEVIMTIVNGTVVYQA